MFVNITKMDSIAVKEIVLKSGADVCGIANIERFEKAPKGFHPSDIFSEVKSIIVFGKKFLKGTYKAKSTAPYSLVRNQLIQQMDDISMKLSYKLEDSLFLAVPIPASEPYEYWDSERRHGRAILSLKHSAELAGLGRIGKNTLLLNKQFGNRLWLGAVLTNAVLDPDPIAENLCTENCSVCVDSCPQSALNGITIEQIKCRKVAYTSTEGGGLLISCNLCRVLCPMAIE